MAPLRPEMAGWSPDVPDPATPTVIPFMTRLSRSPGELARERDEAEKKVNELTWHCAWLESQLEEQRSAWISQTVELAATLLLGLALGYWAWG